MAAAWMLQDHAEVTLFEASKRLGGHVDTHSVLANGRTCSLDTGFSVFNAEDYPEFSRWLMELGVATQPAEASFSVRNVVSGLEYSSNGVAGAFSQPRNLVNPRYLGMLRDIRRLRQLDCDAIDPTMTLEELISREGLGEALVRDYLRPVCATAWALSTAEPLDLPASKLLRFINGYQLVHNSPYGWQVIRGGSRRYVDAFEQSFAGVIRTGDPVRRVDRDAGQIQIELSRGVERFDALVLACHSDQALALLEKADPLEQEILGAMGYADNRVVLHSDARVMPVDRKIWSSWNALVDEGCQVSYWMNRLQTLVSERDFFVTLNPLAEPDQVWSDVTYRHPVVSVPARTAQARRSEINGTSATYYAGAYWGSGSHEDAVDSGVQAAREILKRNAEMRYEASA
jgi:predicted NAD/FAD-binding protein